MVLMPGNKFGIIFLVLWLIFGGLYATRGGTGDYTQLEVDYTPFSVPQMALPRHATVPPAASVSSRDSELESQLHVLNKPPLQSFQKEDGSIIDCIDIYKQPAFDHPKLKNHKIQMKPSLLLQKTTAMSSSVEEIKGDKILSTNSTSNFRKCPSGTVPIRRARKEDLIRAKTALRHYEYPMPHDRLPFNPKQGIHFAGVSTPNATSDRYLGTTMTLSFHKSLHMITTQTSTASARIGSGIDGPYTSIEFGWTINQALYGDLKPRTFGLWTADGYGKTGCFNVLCPGFVQVSKEHLPGEEITDSMLFGEKQKYIYFAISKDPKTLDWWLVQSMPDKTNYYVGYWPKELFADFFPFASNVQIGGKVFNPSLEPFKTPMGSGYFVPDDFFLTADAHFRLVNASYDLLREPQMDLMLSSPEFYKAQCLDGSDVLFGGPKLLN